MTRYLAHANVFGLAVWEIGELDESNAEVQAAVQMGLLVAENPDGTFDDPPPPQPYRCCGR